MTDTAKTTIELDLDQTILDLAASLGLDISRIVDDALRSALREEQARRWPDENAGTIEDYNKHVEESGVPLTRHRTF